MFQNHQTKIFPRRRPPLRTKVKIVAILIFFPVLVLLTSVVVWHNAVNRPHATALGRIEFSVEKGSSVGAIAESLRESGLIKSPFWFRTYVAVSGQGSRLQAGTFILDGQMSISDIAAELAGGKGVADQVRATLPEGGTAVEYSRRLEAAGVISGEVFMDALKKFASAADYPALADRKSGAGLEGYLFPDTYFFKKSATGDEVLAALLENFESKLTPDLRQKIASSGKTIFETIIMASIVEAEVGRIGERVDTDAVARERRLVAGVFYNRLAIGMALQSDATLNYVIGQGRRQASYEDLQLDSPYNTYKHRGLPPGPIGNPSLDSIRAAIEPEQSEYYFFLSKPDGEAVFARTLEEHNANRARYLR